MRPDLDQRTAAALSSASHGGSPRIRDEFERQGVPLPKEAEEFIQHFGGVRLGSVTALAPDGEFSIPTTSAWLRFMAPHFPADLVPLAVLSCDRVVCIRRSDGALRLFDPHLPADAPASEVPASTYGLEVLARLAEQAHRDFAWGELGRQARKFSQDHGYDHATGGSLPKAHAQRPIRFCIQDVIFGVVSVQQSREQDRLDVDLFLAEDIPEYLPDAGAEALLRFLLSEAWRLGTSMRMCFGQAVEGGRIPGAIRRIAHRLDVSLDDSRDVLAPDQARALYVGLTGFSTAIRSRIEALRETGRFSVERACFAVHNGVWTQAEVEYLLAVSAFPDAVLGGLRQPDAGLLYMQDLADATGAVLGGVLDRRLRHRPAHITGDGEVLSDEDAHVAVRILTEIDTGAKVYCSPEPLNLPWLVNEGGLQQVDAEMPFRVFVVCRDREQILRHVRADLRRASRPVGCEAAALLYPADLRDMDALTLIVDEANQAGVAIMVAPRSAAALRGDAAAKLQRSRMSRSD